MPIPKNPFDLPSGPKLVRLSPEQSDTAALLDQLLGKSVSDRYIDFCLLSAGHFDLRVASPIAAHALRELDSILRSTLAAPIDVRDDAAPSKEQVKALKKALKDLGYDDEAIGRAQKALSPQTTHRDKIKKILSRLGLDPEGDVAKSWYSVIDAHRAAHERPFHHSLEVDGDFRRNWAEPFDNVVRGVAVALQSHYSALVKRTEALAAIPNAAQAIGLYEREIPGALPLQWHFFRRLEGDRWLPELIKKDLMLPPPPRGEDPISNQVRLREWPLGAYLLSVAKTGDEASRSLLAEALRVLKNSDHPDVQQDGLQIIAALPGKEAAVLSDVAIEWISGSEGPTFGTHHAEHLLKNVADVGEREATLKIATALLSLSGDDGNLHTHYAHNMYEHSLPKTTEVITKALGTGALKLLVELLMQAGVIDRKIALDPPGDYTSVILASLPEEQQAYGVFDALVVAVKRCAIELIRRTDVSGDEVLQILALHSQKIFKRILLYTLSRNVQADPDLADEILFDEEALGALYLRYEYADLARARFPSLSPERQQELLQLVDALPAKYEVGWIRFFEENQGRQPTADDIQTFRQSTIRNAIWDWRDVLPTDRQAALNEMVAVIGEPDAWLKHLENEANSPLRAADFSRMSAGEIAEYLRGWKADLAGKETKTALAFEFYQAVQGNPAKFADDALAYADLAPLYVRRLFEGLCHPKENAGKFDWAAPLKLLEKVVSVSALPDTNEASAEGDDPSWFWAAKQGAELLRSGLQQGKAGIDVANASLVSTIFSSLEALFPPEPEGTYETLYEQSPYFAAQNTILGLTVELRVLEIFWLSKYEKGSEQGRNSICRSPEFQAFAQRALALTGANAGIVRAIFGRYLGWLYYFGEGWVRDNFPFLFPEDRSLREAAWLAYLINGAGPIPALFDELALAYQDEIDGLPNVSTENPKGWRADRFPEYVVLQYLHTPFPPPLLEKFFENAPAGMRGHAMWFLGSQLNRGPSAVPPDMLARGLAYWEMRLAAAEAAQNKDDYRDELGSIGTWLHDTKLDPKWLVAQIGRMLRAGFIPKLSYNVVEWAAKVADEDPAGAVSTIAELFQSPKVDHWAYATHQAAIRKTLELGIATGDMAIIADVERVISVLASRGETSYLDLSIRN